MTSTLASHGGPALQDAPTGATLFILSLCRLSTRMAIRQPQAPHLKRFTFFAARCRRSDGTAGLYLHMGYFATLVEAQHWRQRMRRVYPEVVVSRAPAARLREYDARIPTLSPAGMTPAPASPVPPPPIRDCSLTDTQVLKILETRRVIVPDAGVDEEGSREISLVRPEDTNTRRALKQAIVEGAPVSFAVQLQWSVRPVELASVPSHPIFRSYTLYLTQGRRDGRRWNCLRLGFFSDAISAKQVAYFLRPSFASVAVVPISEQEQAHASEHPVDPSVLADPLWQSIDRALDPARAPPSPRPSVPARSQSASARAVPTRAFTPPPVPARPANANGRPERSRRYREETLERTLELLVASEICTESAELSETGVRHLKVDILKRTAKRS